MPFQRLTICAKRLQIHVTKETNRPNITDTKGAQAGPAGSTGHSQSKHNFPKSLEIDIINNPERIFTGVNKNGTEVTIFYRNGDAVITQSNNFSRVITAHGSSGASQKSLDPTKWVNDPNFVEIIK